MVKKYRKNGGFRDQSSYEMVSIIRLLGQQKEACLAHVSTQVVMVMQAGASHHDQRHKQMVDVFGLWDGQ